MAQNNSGSSPKYDATQLEAREDAEMRAARRELKQSSISDPRPSTHDDSLPSDRADDCVEIPPDMADTQKNVSKTKAPSPKKKRAHDQLDWGLSTPDKDASRIASTDSAKDRALRLEPEKKRHRDEESTGGTRHNSAQFDTQLAKQKSEDEGSLDSEKPVETSSTAFSASGFSKLAQGSSAFASLGAFGGSSFASSAKTSSTSTQLPKTPEITQASVVSKLTFCENATASPFAKLAAGNDRSGARIGGSFASAVSETKTFTGFATLGGMPLKKGRATRPFGAPESESDVEDGDTEKQGETDSQTDGSPRAPTPEKEIVDKRKTKLHKVNVDDGEAGEATIVSVRAKMFCLDKETGWKERGAGIVKINVPRVCVDFDEAGFLVPGSFNASGFKAKIKDVDEKRHIVARLIMRQNQTHRVILNTVIVPTMQFQEKASLKSVGILFTAIEGEDAKPVRITLRMSATNAKVFMAGVELVQKALRDN